ncbi:MAG TPA: DUF131 domain-containing protein [Euryarchaeota archaeon]|nr:hypothetical protein BMS3Bbin15_01707 [archaeon BMS3Bbin15]HDL15936.1 DUF131 domain-containing protein [Euryarchaeota archaeon]
MKEQLITIGFLFVFIGIIMIMLGSIFSAATGNTETRGGGIVLIGPFPIIFGSDTQSVKSLIILATILIVVVYFLFYRRP